VYRTGDLGRYDPDGAVVLAGRTDDQVKVRGHRVEPAEVEAALTDQPDVTAAVVRARVDGTGETTLIAYVVPARAGVLPAALRDAIAARLPEHARPAALVLVPELPLTANGKLDRAALPEPAAVPVAATVADPVTPTERQVAGIWRDVLGLPRIGVTDNFFEIGGHSLSIVAVHSRLTALGRDGLALVDLFRFPTVRGLAAHLDGAGRAPGLERADRRVAARRGRARPAARRRRTAEEDTP
jgi:hypothetical protein